MLTICTGTISKKKKNVCY